MTPPKFDFSLSSKTVTSSTWVPVGTVFTNLQQNVIGFNEGNREATIRWDAPDINNPKVGFGSNLNDTGTAPPPCFVRGTLIEVLHGSVRIENLKAGNLVLTRDHGFQPIRWIGCRKFSQKQLEAHPNFVPIRIKAGALGKNAPAEDLLVSPQHRVLVCSKFAQRMFDVSEVLVAAKQLHEHIEIANNLTEVESYHILFDHHEIIVSNGTESESLYTGPRP